MDILLSRWSLRAAPLLAVTALVLTLGIGVGRAEEAPMDQGTGAITTRSDVEVAVESLKGVSRARLGAVGQAISSKLTTIRRCYITVTEQRPTKEGSLRIEVRVTGKRGKASVKVARDDVGDKELTGCVVKAIQSADYTKLAGTKAGGLVVVDFANTAAKGVKLVAADRDRAATAVKRDASGLPFISAQTAGGEVRVTITGQGDTSPESVVALHRTVQSRIGKLLDARRRASRRDMDPEGEVAISLRVNKRGVAQGRRLSSSVQDTTAPQRIIKALRGAVRGQRDAAGTYRVLVTFAGR